MVMSLLQTYQAHRGYYDLQIEVGTPGLCTNPQLNPGEACVSLPVSLLVSSRRKSRAFGGDWDKPRHSNGFLFTHLDGFDFEDQGWHCPNYSLNRHWYWLRLHTSWENQLYYPDNWVAEGIILIENKPLRVVDTGGVLSSNIQVESPSMYMVTLP